MADVVILDFEDLVGEKDLSQELETAYGKNGLGVLLVKNIPGYAERRATLLPLSYRFAHLSNEAKQKYEVPESRYNVGWSHGKEAVEGGKKLDLAKGSFYANPRVDVPTEDPDMIQRMPEIFAPNVWPTEDLPELEPAMKSLMTLICDVGERLAHKCDAYIRKICPEYLEDKIAHSIETSRTMKSRLLYYFPPETLAQAVDDSDMSSWCGVHNDHGSITGLTSAMFLDRDGNEIPNPDPKAGLYVINRAGEAVKVNIPAGMLAFQIGEAAQIHSGGILQATPHFVKSVSQPGCESVSRSTCAVFMEPDWDVLMDLPPGRTPEDAEVGAWRPGMTFSDFGEATFDVYYGKK